MPVEERVREGIEAGISGAAFPINLLAASAQAGCCSCSIMLQAVEWCVAEQERQQQQQPVQPSFSPLMDFAMRQTTENNPPTGVMRHCEGKLHYWQLTRFLGPAHGPGNKKNPSFQIFTLPDAPESFHRLPKARPFEFDRSMNACVGQAIEWLNRCLNGHAGCHHEADGQAPLPTRAIWVGDTDDDVRLVNSEGASAPYICLSYKWGGYIPDCITKTESLQRNLTQLEWSTLPRLFQDVIHLTRALKIRYLWIDAVCIVQDDKSDWEKEGTQMAAYYGNAFITLAAVRAETPEESLFSQSAAQDVPHEIVPINPHCVPGRVFVRLGKPHDNDWKALDRSTTPLLTRAWVYQERLLSARVLSFTATELVWECIEDTTCQCVLDNHTPGAPAHKVSKWHWPSIAHEAHTVYPKKVFSNLLLSSPTPSLQQRMHAWYNLVNQYSVLHLSYGTDKLMALSGIAKEMHRIRSSTRYLAGLWEDTLLPDLCWNSSHSGETFKPREYRAPSWSWAAVDHRVGTKFHYQNKHTFDPAGPRSYLEFPTDEQVLISEGSADEALFRARVLEVDISPANPIDTTGPLTAGSLVLEALVFYGVVAYETTSLTNAPRFSAPTFTFEFAADHKLEPQICYDTWVHVYEHKRLCGVVPLVTHKGGTFCLVVYCRDVEGKVFERIGWVYATQWSVALMATIKFYHPLPPSEVSRITIV